MRYLMILAILLVAPQRLDSQTDAGLKFSSQIAGERSNGAWIGSPLFEFDGYVGNELGLWTGLSLELPRGSEHNYASWLSGIYWSPNSDIEIGVGLGLEFDPAAVASGVVTIHDEKGEETPLPLRFALTGTFSPQTNFGTDVFVLEVYVEGGESGVWQRHSFDFTIPLTGEFPATLGVMYQTGVGTAIRAGKTIPGTPIRAWVAPVLSKTPALTAGLQISWDK